MLTSGQRKPASVAGFALLIKADIPADLSLPLLVLGVGADHEHHTLTTHDLAIATDLLD